MNIINRGLMKIYDWSKKYGLNVKPAKTHHIG